MKNFRLLEIDIGLIVGCMPILPALFNHERGFKSWAPYFSSLHSRLHQTRQSSDHAERKDGRLTGTSYLDEIYGTPKGSFELPYVESMTKNPSLMV